LKPGEGLDAIFKPRSVAVIGASPKPRSIGNVIIENLLYSYKGRVYPVNPKYDEIMGLKTYPSILDVPETPDLAVVTIRAERAVKAVEEAGRKGVRAVIVVAGGFAEAGPEGAKLERELVSIVRKYGMRLVGPNCIGVYDAESGVDTFFLPRDRMRRPPKGPIAVVSQSGAFLSTFMDFIATENVGVTRAINFGNKADVDEIDVLAYFSKDKNIKTIMMYLEDVKPGKGQLFMKELLEAREKRGIHTVILKGGRTTTGARAAKSHTAALAGDYQVFSSAIRQAGAVEVYNVYEFVDAANALAKLGPAKGNRVIVITNAGGPGVLSSDLLSQAGLKLPSIPENVKRVLREMFPPRVALGNPIDLTGDASDDDYARVLDVLGEKGDIADMFFVIALMQPPTLSKEIYKTIYNYYKKYNKKIISIIGGSADGDYARLKLNSLGLPGYPLPSRGVSGARALYLAGKPVCKKEWEPVDEWKVCENTIKMDEYEALNTARKSGINVPNYCKAETLDEAVSCFSRLNKPVVAKILSPGVIHKSDIGGVILGIDTLDKLKAAFSKLERLGSYYGFAGVLLMEQVSGSVEVFIGARKDPVFGPIVLFGGGGISVELYRDVAIRVAPINMCEATSMIDDTKIGAMLSGYRGTLASREPVIDMLIKISDIIVNNNNIAEIDLNPVIVQGDLAYAVDIRINTCKNG